MEGKIVEGNQAASVNSDFFIEETEIEKGMLQHDQ